MFSSLTTKLAMKKMGISSDTFNLSLPDMSGGGAAADSDAKAGANKLKKTRTGPLPPGTVPGLDDDDLDGNGRGGGSSGGKQWPAWMSVKALPLTVQPWLTPPPAPIPVATACPKKGDAAPLDRDRKLTVGGGAKPVVVVFLRCVGCAFAQKTFLNLRTLANRYAGQLTCIAVSHSSLAATQKWLDLLGGAWNVQVVIDEDRAVYAAWGLGLGSVWYVLNPSTQIQGWKETGWLGQTVAGYMEKRQPGKSGGAGAGAGADKKNGGASEAAPPPLAGTGGSGVVDAVSDGPATIMGNKWQQAGAFAVNSRGIVMFGQKALRADDVLDLDQAIASLGL
ncbi:uncharacterized protein SPSK_02604 [Sporothrix schenckii 1099-18]|uniref:Uncharacterized protein n=1 Tax=Sporothrix schenckii 1099-18 TaxID=1397361 RepID=A0A0F2M938_SPOSC|nr:uncharacterized protein SPSK_02604 [Sporothrix schenckii 1099-18]KJR86152.1 hypothetical protein SPSK_02604 [Sporothrix schenckii 1099-18]